MTGVGGAGGSGPSSGVRAVAINVTAVSPTRGTYLTAYPDGESRPLASNLNAPAGTNVPNLAIVDGSVFVTAAAVNPTPTIQALALRTADHMLATRH